MPEHEHKGHRQRLRNRFLSSSLASFAPHEVLELLLSYCIPQSNVNPLAHRLIDRFGSVAGVLDATPEELQSVSGIGTASAEFLKLLPAFIEYYRFDKHGGKQWLLTPFGLSEYCAALFEDEPCCDMLLIALNVQGELLGHWPMVLPKNATDVTAEYQRIAANMAMQSGAYAIVIAHRHADGSIEPDDFDIQFIYDMRAAMDPIGVLLLDQMIVGADDICSMAIQGFISFSGSVSEFARIYLASATGLSDANANPVNRPHDGAVDAQSETNAQLQQ